MEKEDTDKRGGTQVCHRENLRLKIKSNRRDLIYREYTYRSKSYRTNDSIKRQVTPLKLQDIINFSWNSE